MDLLNVPLKEGEKQIKDFFANYKHQQESEDSELKTENINSELMNE